MKTPDFDAAKYAAANLLLQQNITQLRFDIRQFHFDRKIIIDSIQRYSQITHRPPSDFMGDGIEGVYNVNLSNGYALILYDDTCSNSRRKHWGIVHEVGHIYREHIDDSSANEVEAHFFAAELVAPEAALLYLAERLGKVTVDDVYHLFNISYEAACRRIRTLKHKYFFDASALDKKLLCKLRPWLDQYIEKHQTNSNRSVYAMNSTQEQTIISTL